MSSCAGMWCHSRHAHGDPKATHMTMNLNLTVPCRTSVLTNGAVATVAIVVLGAGIRTGKRRRCETAVKGQGCQNAVSSLTAVVACRTMLTQMRTWNGHNFPACAALDHARDERALAREFRHWTTPVVGGSGWCQTSSLHGCLHVHLHRCRWANSVAGNASRAQGDQDLTVTVCKLNARRTLTGRC